MNMLERGQLKVKVFLFSVMRETMNQFVPSSLIFKVFIFIEMLQSTYFILHPEVSFQFSILFVQYYTQVLQYSQLNYVISLMDASQTLIIVYMAFSIQCLIFVVIGVGGYMLTIEDKISTFTSYCFKTISFYAFVLNTILQTNMINVYVSVIYCDAQSQFSGFTNCYTGSYLVHLIFSILGILMYYVSHTYILMFYIDMRPTSDVPFAQQASVYSYWKMIFKTVMVVFVTLDYNGTQSSLYLIILDIIYFLSIMLHVYDPMHYKNDVFYYLLTMDCVLFTISISITLHQYLDQTAVNGPDNVGFYYILIFIPAVLYCTTLLVQAKQNYLLRNGVKKLSEASHVDEYLYLLIHLIDKRDQLNNYVVLEGIRNQHMMTCMNSSCSCFKLQESKNIDQQDDLFWNQFLVILIEFSIQRFPKATSLHLLLAYIQNDRMQNPFKCYYETLVIKTLDPTLREEFEIYRIIRSLEETMLEEEQRQDQYIDVMKVVKFQKYYGTFQLKLEESVNRHLEFWNELMEHNPDIQKLYSLGGSITQSVEDVRDVYTKLININPSHINSLKIYGQFELDVINNDTIGQRIIEKADQIEKTYQMFQYDTDADKYGENSKTCIMTVSAEAKNLGCIQTCNKDISLLGFHKYELINQSIQRIMPKCYANYHDGMMQRYLETSQSTVVGVERTLMCQHRQGHLVPCSVMFRVLPVLNKGIRMVSFIKNIHTDYYYILFDPKSLMIQGISKNIQDQFGIRPDLAYGNIQHSNEFTMEAIIKDCKHLLDKLTNEQYLNQQLPFKLILDSLKYSTLFLMGQSMEMDEFSQGENLIDPVEKMKASPFREKEIKCYLQKYILPESELMLMKFTEDDDSGDIMRTNHFHENKLKTKSKTKTSSNSKSKSKVQSKKDQHQDDFINEDRSSVNSIQSSLNDDMRKLKDFKALMSEKTVPRTIRTIEISTGILALFLLALAIGDLVFKYQSNNEFWIAGKMLSESHTRLNEISTLQLYSRLLQLQATGVYTNISVPNTIQSALITSINQRIYYLLNLSFDILQLRSEFNRGSNTFPVDHFYNMTELLATGSYKIYNVSLISSLLQYYNSIIQVINGNLTQFVDSTYIAPVPQAFYFIRQNGLLKIRSGQEFRNTEYLNFCNNLANDKFKYFLIIMILALFFMVLVHVIVLPILLNVDKANNKVLSLFGLIPVDEIKVLADKCEEFLKKYIEDFEERRLIEKKAEEPEPAKDNIYIEVNNEEKDEEQEKLREQQQFFEEQERKNQIFQQEQLQKEIERKKGQQYKKKDRDRKKKKKQEMTQLELTEAEKERVEKLQTSTNSRDTTILFKIAFFFAIISGFFIMQLVLEKIFLNNMNFVYNHIDMSHSRYSRLSYRIVFGLEDVIQNTTIKDEGDDLQTYYHND